ncbi:hypothetical protein SAMN05880501_10699 [Ureibacillus xyleni]|uniref:Outer membrane lipoprotein-sorting protein n=1 Tax=Ureibacillus xyleni TaxID=614648 RepID=A0A285SS88_9BACL|nr:hypothetical protein [Ureibacillus xyleni]SOC11190.1 hypothetical protein SAMN05880501_10699 [Ureibacillus xyleni]
MFRKVILCLVCALVLPPMLFLRADVTHKLNIGEVNSIQVKRLVGESRTFQINDGYEEIIINKVINWINTSIATNGREIRAYKSPVKLFITMKNGDIAQIEPLFRCDTNNGKTECAIVDGQVLYTQSNLKIPLMSQDLYDWLLVGWKYESYGASKEELLSETLYFRYYTHLDEKYADFIMCPKIESIERIEGALRSHIIQASALNYGAHHGNVLYDRIRFTISDTQENGIKITNVSIEKGISEMESLIQCRREN